MQIGKMFIFNDSFNSKDNRIWVYTTVLNINETATMFFHKKTFSS